MPVVLPIGHFDAGPASARIAAPVTAAFAVLCVLVFVGPQDLGRDLAWTHAVGAIPAEITGASGAHAWAGLATSLVAHASWAHLFYNLVALWVFGSVVERSLGSARTLALYVGAGTLAVLAQVLTHAGSGVPIVGASGAVAAAAGAFAVGYPRSRVVVAALFLTVPVPAWVALGVWAGAELIAAAPAFEAGPVAHVAHLCGFAIGTLAMSTLRDGPYRL